VPGTGVPRLLADLIDDAAALPPGGEPIRSALSVHRGHRIEWYAPVVGRFLVPASCLAEAAEALDPGEVVEIGVVCDVPLDRLDDAVRRAGRRLVVRHVEAAVARRGEDPQAGLDVLLPACRQWPGVTTYAEVPLTGGLLGALDRVAGERERGLAVAAKFRTGGLAAELFPTPMELAAIVCACHDRSLPFRLTAGLHRALRHNDPETGLTHHGFLNVLAAVMTAAEGGEVVTVAEQLAATDPLPLIEAVRPRRFGDRPLWAGFGATAVGEPVEDLRALGLLAAGPEEPATPNPVAGRDG
jgi:hypothetical protein